MPSGYISRKIVGERQFVGKKAVRDWFENLMEPFPQLKFTVHSVSVSNLFALTGNNEAAVHWTVSLTNKTVIIWNTAG